MWFRSDSRTKTVVNYGNMTGFRVFLYDLWPSLLFHRFLFGLRFGDDWRTDFSWFLVSWFSIFFCTSFSPCGQYVLHVSLKLYSWLHLWTCMFVCVVTNIWCDFNGPIRTIFTEIDVLNVLFKLCKNVNPDWSDLMTLHDFIGHRRGGTRSCGVIQWEHEKQ